VAARFGTPYGVVVHGADLMTIQEQIEESALKRRAAMALLSSASVLLANSRWTAELCRVLLAQLGIDPAVNLIRTVPLGTDPVFFRPGIDTSVVRTRYGLPQRRWLLTVARLSPEKGIHIGIQALAHLSNEFPDLGYLVVGSGEELQYLQRLAASLGLADRVKHLTGVPDADLPGLYNCAEIYLGASQLIRRGVEGFGISQVEASACAVPVVAARSGGIPDAVRDGETGLLVDAERAECVAEALALLLRNRELSGRLGNGGRRAVETFFNWGRVTSQMMKIGTELGRSTRLASVR
jgi:phosphatidylinositol alpha-1,6-mannosyltransferase